MLNCLEVVREPSAHHQLVLPVLVVGSYLLLDQPLVVFEKRYTFDHAVNLHAVRKELDFALLVKHRLLALWT